MLPHAFLVCSFHFRPSTAQCTPAQYHLCLLPPIGGRQAASHAPPPYTHPSKQPYLSSCVGPVRMSLGWMCRSETAGSRGVCVWSLQLQLPCCLREWLQGRHPIGHSGRSCSPQPRQHGVQRALCIFPSPTDVKCCLVLICLCVIANGLELLFSGLSAFWGSLLSVVHTLCPFFFWGRRPVFLIGRGS